MDKEKGSSVKKYIITALPFAVPIIITILTPYAENIDEINPLLTLGWCFAFLGFYLICIFGFSFIHQQRVQSVVKSSEKTRISYIDSLEKISSEFSPPKGKEYCLKNGYLCSAQKIIESDYYGRIVSALELTEADCEYYNLVKDSDFDEKEYVFFDEHPSGEIWVVSNALETEIKTEDEFKTCPDESLRKSMMVVRENIIRGGRYTQFVSLGPQGLNDVTFENRCRVYWSALPDLDDYEKRLRMPIIRIDDVFQNHARQRVNDPDYEYLVKLTSTVLFVDNSNELFVEGFFCLRPDDSVTAKEYERKTIFFKMPICMRDDYYFFLKAKKEEYEKELKKTMKGV